MTTPPTALSGSLLEQTPAATDAATQTGPSGGGAETLPGLKELMEDPQRILEVLESWATDFGPKVLAALATLVIGVLVAKAVTRAIRRLMVKAHLDATLARFLSSIAYMGLVVLVLITAVGQLGVQTTSFVAIIGAAGLAVGFALQGSLGNLAAGVMIILFRPFKAGDFVEAGGHSGVIEEIQIFATVMRTGDNKKIILPNSSVTDGSIVNYSAKDTRRVDLVFGIGYSDDIDAARQVIGRILEADPRVLKDPAPVVAVSELADSSVNFVVRPWVATADYWNVRFDLIERVKLAFDQSGISIPFPQRDVHLIEPSAEAA